MRGVTLAVAALLGLGSGALAAADEPPALRAPSVPLVTHNPYFSAWMNGDDPTRDWPRHWTGTPMGMCGMAWIDGTPWRFMGTMPREAKAMTCSPPVITPTRTTYVFTGGPGGDAGGVRLQVSFLSPVIADDADLASRAVTYIDIEAASADGSAHEVKVYLDFSGEWAVHEPSQAVTWSRHDVGGTQLLSIGSQSQRVLERAGDHTRIDWGRLYVGVAAGDGQSVRSASDDACRGEFVKHGNLPMDDDLAMPRAAGDRWPVLAMTADLGRVVSDQPKGETFYIAYDDGHCAEYFGRKLRPYWARGGKTFAEMLRESVGNRDEVDKACRAFDEKLGKQLRAATTERLSRLCELSFRQVMAAHVIAADFDGTMLMFSKENTSNGCMGTVDVTFPGSPMFVALAPEMLEAQLRPVLDYAASPRWTFAFAPHDLGTYPKANGQVYGGGERTQEDQMPVEETANMLIMLCALGERGQAKDLISRRFDVLTKWAEYLTEHGLDPENQLCTDDFTGHLARNANLAAKATVALGAYARLCELNGRTDAARESRATAERFVREWIKLAGEGGGDHTVLAYGQPNTWSLKYNIFWDNALKLSLFPAEIKRREIAEYLEHRNPFGVPMDNRAAFTKPEWVVWSACMAERPEDFAAMTDGIYDMACKTPDRVPLTDWYMTTDARKAGFHARSVLGGLFAPLLIRPASR